MEFTLALRQQLLSVLAWDQKPACLSVNHFCKLRKMLSKMGPLLIAQYSNLAHRNFCMLLLLFAMYLHCSQELLYAQGPP